LTYFDRPLLLSCFLSGVYYVRHNFSRKIRLLYLMSLIAAGDFFIPDSINPHLLEALHYNGKIHKCL
jgi:hypothetical protein